MAQFLYVLLGGFLTIIGTYITDVVRTKKEEEIYVKRKREAVYLKAIELIYKMTHCLKVHATPKEAEEISLYIKKEREKFHYEFIVYASKDVRDLFLDIISVPDRILTLSGSDEYKINELRNTIYTTFVNRDSEIFLDLIRKEIGTYETYKSKKEAMFYFRCNLCSWFKNKFSKK